MQPVLLLPVLIATAAALTRIQDCPYVDEGKKRDQICEQRAELIRCRTLFTVNGTVANSGCDYGSFCEKKMV